MLGCSLHCGYCQNWVSSQALREIRSTLEFREIRSAEIVRIALAGKAAAVQVAGRDWTATRLVDLLLRKAGLRPDANGTPGMRLYVFQAQVFQS